MQLEVKGENNIQYIVDTAFDLKEKYSTSNLTGKRDHSTDVFSCFVDPKFFVLLELVFKIFSKKVCMYVYLYIYVHFFKFMFSCLVTD